MDTFTYVPSYSTQGESVPRMLRARFGDGYEQVALDGINAILRTWHLTFNNIHATTGTTPTASALKTFFEDHAGLRFFWTQPAPYATEGARVFECTDYNFEYVGGLIMNVRATFVQKAQV